MNLQKTLDQINKSRNKAECCFVFALWKDPELYGDYMYVNENGDTTLRDKDAIFYFRLGKELYKRGYRSFDAVTLDTYLEEHPKVAKVFEGYGGFHETEVLRNLVDLDNLDTYFDQILKMNSLSTIAEKYDELFENVSQFDSLTNDEVYGVFDLLNASAALSTGNDVKIDEVTIDDQYLKNCDTGLAKGLDYGKHCPILNYMTLGIPRGELTMLAGYSGSGKSSWIFENIIIPFHSQGLKVAIISNEMRVDAYKNMLLAHILTRDMNYWGLTRKKLKIGGFNDEQWEKLREAQRIQQEKYSGITFIKMFDNDTNNVVKYMRKLAHSGYVGIVYDTFKGGSENMTESMWQELLMTSRKIFQVASKYNLAVLTTYQLALHTLNQRYLDAGALSNSKQIKEVFSEIIMMRNIWDDEFSGEKHDIKPYSLKKDENGKWIRDETIQLDRDNSYLVFFLEKTRNDEANQQVVYRFDGRYNNWREIGRCTVINDHKGGF